AAWIAIGTGILLGLRFGHVTVVVGLVVLGVADQAVARWGDAGDLREIVAVLVVLNLAGLAWTPERLARRNRVRLWTAPLAHPAHPAAVAGDRVTPGHRLRRRARGDHRALRHPSPQGRGRAGVGDHRRVLRLRLRRRHDHERSLSGGRGSGARRGAGRDVARD